MKPKRIQLRRTKGWKMPPNTVKVDRSTKFGNPFKPADALEAGFVRSLKDPLLNLFLVDCFRDWMDGGQSGRDWWQGPKSDECKASINAGLAKLRGKNLACWCKIGEPCHADVLLELANDLRTASRALRE